MEKDFITALPDSGGDGSVNVAAKVNTGAARSSSITVSGSGVSKTVDIGQVSAPFISFDTVQNPTPTDVIPTPPVNLTSGTELALESYIKDVDSLKGKKIELYFNFEPFVTNQTVRGVSFLKMPDSIQVSYGTSLAFPDFIEVPISFRGGDVIIPLRIKLKG